MIGRLTLHSEGARDPHVISILSGKGGVGKSVIAFNLADTLAAEGKRVLLVDADFSGANLALLANAAVSSNAHNYIRGEQRLSEAVTRLNPRLDLLGSGAASSGAPTYTNRQIARFAARLREDASLYDFVIMDHASGAASHLDILAHASHLNLLVIVPELTSIADGYGLYKHLLSFTAEFEARLMLNRVISIEDRDALYTKFRAMTERFLGQSPRLFGTLPESSDLPKSVAAQQPVRHLAPESIARQAFVRLAANLITGRHAPVSQESAPVPTHYELRTTADIRK